MASILPSFCSIFFLFFNTNIESIQVKCDLITVEEFPREYSIEIHNVSLNLNTRETSNVDILNFTYLFRPFCAGRHIRSPPGISIWYWSVLCQFVDQSLYQVVFFLFFSYIRLLTIFLLPDGVLIINTL